jgi:hypothetical protein
MFGSRQESVVTMVAVLVGIAGVSWLLIGTAAPPASAQSNGLAAPVEFTADGKLKQPVGYRKWCTSARPRSPSSTPVYMDPESFAHHEKTGKFRDGTVIKELSSVGSKKAPSGNGYFQGELTGLEAAIKDSKRFKDEPGNWAYFSFGHKYPRLCTSLPQT